MYAEREGGRKEEIPLLPSPPTFIPAVEFIILISPGAGKLSGMPDENFKNEALI